MKKLYTYIFVLIFSAFSSTYIYSQNTYANISADSAYAMIQANLSNPDFIILDVRTPAEYIPEHIENAVNLNYYNSDFSETLDTLIKTKKYLIHCHSGSRSGKAFKIMKELKFKEVYNMLGGISSWKNKSYPTTNIFKPILMKVSKDSIVDFGNIHIGYSDTIDITITNFGNDTLRFVDYTDLSSTEFSTNFDSDRSLTGFDDYTFQVYYTPVNYASAHSDFSINSNGGDLTFSLRGFSQSAANKNLTENDNISAYPNPASDYIYLKCINNMDTKKIEIFDFSGNKVDNYSTISNTIDLRYLDNGIYILNIIDDKATKSIKIIKR